MNKVRGSLGVAVILYTDFTNLTDWHGKAFKKIRENLYLSAEGSVYKGFNHGDSQ